MPKKHVFLALSIVLLSWKDFALAGVPHPYKSREECTNRELQKYSEPNQVALVTAIRFCNDYFVRIEKLQVERCGLNYDKASKAGATHEQIMRVAREDAASCLEKIER
jgi:hypothetical protein